ncbi:AmmeMemoRadiSam system protein A [Candidatus Woesearchaeota archaeon]|nr:AmmeMemoRadiSam system protein A [Candidatus Woesearchaeota archaeon]
MLSPEEGKILVKFARESIKTSFSDKSPETETIKKFSKNQGVFVTLHKHGNLRGCIGYPEPVFPLNRAIMQAARAAAFQDPRFPPLQENELNEIDIEISVLTVPQLIEVDKSEDYLGKIKIGEDGLIIRTGFGSGLLLPQVFPEYNATPKQALEMTCQKAGLPSNYWKKIKEAKIYKFQAQIFGEIKPNGEVEEREK